eukprot:CAMPEP_0172390136 /NCGR_PEP_ID=MMETSP1061-20121228/6854_1 /TAXON_ID=37318 /ORGANISM="Pseudo-nitzschia pungens, Strain cf. pungens" /LENGTH=634 /DNA_ID=CAMNT_0013120427 /DNA_START=278 /DNA_END=2178 /DNA_ORIENTATION=-
MATIKQQRIQPLLAAFCAILLLHATLSAAFQSPRALILPEKTKSKTKTEWTTFTSTTTATATAKPFVRWLFASSSSSEDSGDSDSDSPSSLQPYERKTDTIVTRKTAKPLLPAIGDVVLYYDLDGGKADGRVLVGKISYVFGSPTSGYSAELNELEDVGDGYFAEYSSALRSRKGRKTERYLKDVRPLAASFVGSEQAYKVPLDAVGLPKPRQGTYDLDQYEGPNFYANVNGDVVARDAEKYSALKSKLFRNVALTGLVGTIVTNASYGSELAIIYFAGTVASLLYLFLLSVKTDTVAVNQVDNTQNLSGTPIANLRFGAPVLVLIGVSLYNTQKMSSGLGGDDEFTMELFDTVTRQQFGAAVLGFLTYRVPLFVGQIRDAFKELEAETAGETDALDSGISLPGSAGVAAKMLGRGKAGDNSSSASNDGVTVVLVSGPQATGRSELVQKLLLESSSSSSSTDNDNDNDIRSLVAPNRVRKNDDGATFERLQNRGEFLEMDASSGLTAGGIVSAARGLSAQTGLPIPNRNVVVVDASVEVAKKLATSTDLPENTRLIGVWVGLESVQEFRNRLEEDIANGALKIPDDDTQESFLRAKLKDIVNEIDFGLGSGIFEFTILNDASDPDKSLQELREA